MTRPFTLGIDIGNTNVKCVALSDDAEQLVIETTPTLRPAERIGSSAAGLDMAEVWKVVSLLIGRTVRRLRLEHPGSTIAGVAVASAGGAAVLLDAEGRQLYDGVADPSASALFRRYREAMTDEEYAAKTGNPFGSGWPAFVLGAFREQPQRWQEFAALTSLADYIAYRLTGDLVREPSLGGAMGLTEVQTGELWSQLLEDLELEPQQLGRPVRSGEPIGPVTPAAAEATGLPVGTVVYAGGHDYLCAALATGCGDGGPILNVLGTYEIIAAFTDRPARPPATERPVFIDRHVVPGRLSLMTELLSGGRVDRLAHAITGEPARDDCLGDAEPLALASGRPLFVPVLPEDESLDALLRPGAADGPKNLLRAQIEGLCLAGRPAFDLVGAVPDAGPQLVAVGGGSRSRFWMQTKADVLGREVVVPDLPEATAVGAALLAAIGAGLHPDASAAAQACARRGSQSFAPDARRHAYYETYYAEVFAPARDALLRLTTTAHPRKEST